MSKKTLEDYMLCLGKLALIMQMLSKEQTDWLKIGILNNDECELAETIKWNCEKVLTSIDDQVRSVGERTPHSWEETLKNMMKNLKEEERK